MSDSFVAEQSTKLIGQIIDDHERLKEEFLALNVEEILENVPSLAPLVLHNLMNIKNHMQISYMFLDGMNMAKKGQE
jgi:hypothetical protein